jgi:hypothetical protein
MERPSPCAGRAQRDFASARRAVILIIIDRSRRLTVMLCRQRRFVGYRFGARGSLFRGKKRPRPLSPALTMLRLVRPCVVAGRVSIGGCIEPPRSRAPAAPAPRIPRSIPPLAIPPRHPVG